MESNTACAHAFTLHKVSINEKEKTVKVCAYVVTGLSRRRLLCIKSRAQTSLGVVLQ
jgi:hypothetical protein